MNKPSSKIKNVLSSLPDQPGVYIMKNSQSTIIYIGKAKSLKKRVSTYFHKNVEDPKVKALLNNISDIEYIVTDSEIEALILESTLIKKHKPKYNISLKDDKRYPYIAITLSEEYPRIIYTRKLIKNKDKYFGPYTDAKAAKSIVSIINDTFKLKECKKKLPLSSQVRPCINYGIKRCSGVCQGIISRKEYREIIDRVIQFLEGDIVPVNNWLNKNMTEFSDNQEYEKAAKIRDIIFDIQKITEKQKVYTPIGKDQDYIGVLNQGDEAIVILFEFRNGVLLGRKIYIFENTEYYDPGEIIRTFMIRHYDESKIPPRIITQFPINGKKLITELFGKKSSRKIGISFPRTRDEKGIIKMLQNNLNIITAERNSYIIHQDKETGLNEISKILNMNKIPEIIECFDISNLQGKNPVASMVRFKNGIPEKSNYRRYRIKTYDSPNDPGMIHEAVGRRLQYLLNENLDLPDLIVIDGGKGQLNRALEIKDTLEIDLNIISIAKQFEEIYTESSKMPVRLDKSSPALKIIQNIRDEAHRFAINYHRKLRDKDTDKSILSSIPDIGTKRKQLLLKHFKDIKKLKKATIDEINAVPGIGVNTAKAVYEHFNSNN